jgi:transposase InsO family protein
MSSTTAVRTCAPTDLDGMLLQPADEPFAPHSGTRAPSIHRWRSASCREAGVRPSTGSVGDAYDNAMCESFFATLECELLGRRCFTSQAEARMAVFT